MGSRKRVEKRGVLSISHYSNQKSCQAAGVILGRPPRRRGVLRTERRFVVALPSPRAGLCWLPCLSTAEPQQYWSSPRSWSLSLYWFAVVFGLAGGVQLCDSAGFGVVAVAQSFVSAHVRVCVPPLEQVDQSERDTRLLCGSVRRWYSALLCSRGSRCGDKTVFHSASIAEEAAWHST